ncbi:MAG TPA: DUF4350 domain-containing protein [Verrucomicrobiae bacterium]|nr:DUF4350 domain-containing protein [Verrucomicrobiae bacterium]
MPLNSSEKRGFLVIGIILLLLATVVAWLNSDNADQEAGHPSSYSVKRNGAKAAFLLLQQSGYPVERWEKSPAELPEDASDTTLVLAGPESYPTGAEYSGIVRFLLRGGHVLLAGTSPDRFLPQAASDFGEGRAGKTECKPVAPTRLTRGGPISQDGDLVWNHDNEAVLVHYADQEKEPVVVSYPLGRGEVVWWASALPLTNSGIRDHGNLDLLLNSVGDSKRILWDEYYHQQHSAESAGSSNPAQMWALGQAAFLGVLLVLTFSRRSGPMVPLAQESRLSPLEFVETLGNVFQRAKGTQVAVEIALNRFQQMAARRLGIRGNTSPNEVVQAMAQHGLKLPVPIGELVSRSADAAADPDLGEKRALEYVRALNQAMRMLDPQVTPPRERKG